MTCKEQNKILDDKIESNVNQYKLDRLNAEISAFSSGDLNKYEFLTRKDLKYKPNALDKARFEFSPLGKTFSTGLDKTVPNYQEEGVIKLLKDIRDGLRVGIGPLGPGGHPGPPGPGGLDRPDDDNDDNDDNDANDMPDLETEEAAERIAKTSGNDKVFNVLNKFKNNIESEMSNLYKMVTDIENKWSKKNDYSKLLLEYNQSYNELNRTKNELYETRNKLDKAGNDVNEKKYIDELKEIQEKFDYQNDKVKELETELNEKNKNINTFKIILKI